MEGRQIFEEYEKKQKGLGFRFLESLERAYDELIKGANYTGLLTQRKFIAAYYLIAFLVW